MLVGGESRQLDPFVRGRPARPERGVGDEFHAGIQAHAARSHLGHGARSVDADVAAREGLRAMGELQTAAMDAARAMPMPTAPTETLEDLPKTIDALGALVEIDLIVRP